MQQVNFETFAAVTACRDLSKQTLKEQKQIRKSCTLVVTWEKENLDPVQVGRARNRTETHAVLDMAGEEAPLQVCISTTLLNPLPHHALSRARSCAGSFPCKADSYEMLLLL